jgi:cytosine/uracil/thiamine/allantoin permease
VRVRAGVKQLPDGDEQRARVHGHVPGPSLAIYAADIIMRRNRYDGPALHDVSHSSPFWFRGGVNWSGVSALLAGTAAALLCVNTTLFKGPVATALGGGDISSLAGPLVGAVVYVGLSLTLGNHRTGNR